MAKSRKMLDKRMIRIQSQAYYEAMKKYNAENETEDVVKENNRESLGERILFGLNLFFWPWKINKKFRINKKIYDDILVLIITAIFTTSGGLLWGAGILTTLVSLVKLIQNSISFYTMLGFLGITTLMIGFGSVFIVAGNEFSKVTDSNKIYAYSASVLAVVSCIVAILSFLKHKI